MERKVTKQETKKKDVTVNKIYQNGITLIALVVTIVVLIILATISINAVLGENGLIKKVEASKSLHEISKAREQLTLTLGNAGIEKRTNQKYDQDEFLDAFILRELPDAKIKGDIVIIDGYAFELDRSVPKIGRYVGKENELVFPEIVATSSLSENMKTATIQMFVKEEKNGINKIEIWLEGEKIDEYLYEKAEKEVTEEYIAKQNGQYIIKAYGEFKSTEKVVVEGITSSVKFEPDGNSEWKKEHVTTIIIQEVNDKVRNAKYKWINSVTEPEDEEFIEDFKSEDTITKNLLTGTYYLWTKVEMESGEKLKWRSQEFNFDNSGPEISSLTATALTYSSFKLDITAQDEDSGIVEYEFFVGGVSKGSKTVNEIKTSDTQELTITDAVYGDNNCYVMVTDKVGNTTRKDITATTLIDSTGPNITNFTATKYSETGMTLSVTAQDTEAGIVKIEFYIDDILKFTQPYTKATTTSVTVTQNISGIKTGNHSCKVIVYDAEDNSSIDNKVGTTKLYAWNKYDVQWKYSCQKTVYDDGYMEGWRNDYTQIFGLTSEPSESNYFNSETGNFKSVGTVLGRVMDVGYPGDGSVRWIVEETDIGFLMKKQTFIQRDPTGTNQNLVRVEMWKLTAVKSAAGPSGSGSTVTSTNSGEFPSSGEKGGYWYSRIDSI